MDRSELISLLERDMAEDISAIDVPADQEESIDLAKVQEW